MATISERIGGNGPTFSVEFFPPKTEDAEATLWRAVRRFEDLDPAFVSMTYGAGGSSRDHTIGTTGRIIRETTLTGMAHLTAVNHSLDDIHRIMGSFADEGITNVLALRGDPPGDKDAEWVAHPHGLTYAEELVRVLRESGKFCVGVAAFPYGHPRSVDEDSDAKFFAQKADAGAEFALTQMFFNPDAFLRMRDRISAAGCDIPIMPSLMPIVNERNLERGADFSGAPIPDFVNKRLLPLFDDKAGFRDAGIDLCVELSHRLLREGVVNLHYISFNFATAVTEVITRLGAHRAPTDLAGPTFALGRGDIPASGAG
ncbi:MAG TPA: methylenetetrahydrofolate reductase [Pseudonocardia sp.]|jgi:methylenetetrahydrofolate reductase (NADPH)